LVLKILLQDALATSQDDKDHRQENVMMVRYQGANKGWFRDASWSAAFGGEDR
jgi:hypothetical protein